MGSTGQRDNGIVEEYGSNLKILPPNDQIRELQTILRDRYVFILRQSIRAYFDFLSNLHTAQPMHDIEY